MAKILDGRVVRDQIAQKLNSQISALRSQPKLVIIQIGDLEQSNTYIRQKVLFGQKTGAIVDNQKFPENVTAEKLITQISALNTDRQVTGIIVQQPLPAHLDKNQIVDAIDPLKDVDGQTAINIKKLMEGPSRYSSSQRREVTDKNTIDSRESSRSARTITSGFTPATTRGILTLLDFYKIPIAGKHIVVVGRSSLVGKPTALALLNRDATVTVCHSRTNHLSLITSHCDILVVAAGKPRLITKEHVSKGQVVVDVGINVINTRLTTNDKRLKPETELAGRKLVGDVDFDSVSKIVKAISPVPGGVGPMTVASLFENLLEAYHRQT